MDLEQLATQHRPDVLTIQETTLKTQDKTPYLQGYTASRKDGQQTDRGLLTYIQHDIKFTDVPTNTPNKTELQMTRLHLSTTQDLYIANAYIHPRTEEIAADDDKTENLFRQMLRQDNTVITGDVNAHSNMWFSPTTDHRGDYIANIINDSDHIIINANTPTRLPFSRQDAPHQRPTSPDITAIPMRLLPHTTWTTFTQLSSDHLPILTTIDTHLKTKLRHIKTFINFKKARWDDFTAEIETELTDRDLPDNVHEATKQLTNIIQRAHKNHIPQGNIRPKTTILPDDIRQLIYRRNDIRQTNSDDPEIPTLNTEITAAIRDHKRRLWREHLDKAWDYRQNTNILYDTIRRLQNKRSADEPNRTITFNNKVKVTDKDIANAFTKQYTNSTPKETDKQNRTIDRHIKRLRSNAVLLTTRDTNKAIQKTSTKKSLGPDNSSYPLKASWAKGNRSNNKTL